MSVTDGGGKERAEKINNKFNIEWSSDEKRSIIQRDGVWRRRQKRRENSFPMRLEFHVEVWRANIWKYPKKLFINSHHAQMHHTMSSARTCTIEMQFCIDLQMHKIQFPFVGRCINLFHALKISCPIWIF